MPGLSEWFIILIIVLIVFGAGKLPQVGEALGRSIRGFKKASSGEDEKPAEPKAESSESRESKKSPSAS